MATPTSIDYAAALSHTGVTYITDGREDGHKAELPQRHRVTQVCWCLCLRAFVVKKSGPDLSRTAACNRVVLERYRRFQLNEAW